MLKQQIICEVMGQKATVRFADVTEGLQDVLLTLQMVYRTTVRFADFTEGLQVVLLTFPRFFGRIRVK